MRRGRIVLAGVATLALALACVGPATAASRGPGKVLVRKASTLLPGVVAQTGTATATCPRGSRAISGGWLAGSTTGGQSFPFPYESRRLGLRSWRTSVALGAGTMSETRLTTFVYCSRRARRAIVRRASAELPGSQWGMATATARCPRGRKATAGGFLGPAEIPDVFGFITESWRRGPRAWSATVVDGTAGGGAFTVFAYCSPRAGTPLRKRLRRVAGPLGGAAGRAVTPRCPSWIGARAGGFRYLGSPGTFQLAVLENRRRGRTWATGAVARMVPADLQTAAFAYCY